MPDSKKPPLSITLTEPIIFLRSSDPSGRRRPDPNDPPTLVRGILNLNVAKPIDISSIEVELSGVLTLYPPEEVASRRIEVPEKKTIYSSTLTIFRADQLSWGKRPASVGPGLSSTANSANDRCVVATLPRRHSERRRSPTAVPQLHLDPTPPYTYVAQSPTTIQSRLGSPTETLEELRQAPWNDPSGFIPPSTPPHSTGIFLPITTTQSNSSSNSHDSLRREDNHHLRDTAYPSEGDASFHNAAGGSSHVPLRRGSSPIRPSHSPANTFGSLSRTRVNGRNTSSAPTSRSRLHLSLSSVLDAVMEVASKVPSMSWSATEETERGRTRIRNVAGKQSKPSVLEGGEGVAGTSTGSTPIVDSPQESSHKGWREFKPGTYNYPISFLLPSNLPPTFAVPRGSLTYVIKAVAHRPGTFTHKLSHQVPLMVVAAPTTGDGEGGGDLGPLVVQKQWEGKLAFSLGLSSRLFLLGSRRPGTTASESVRANGESPVEVEAEARAEAGYGTVMMDLTLLPLEKIRIWKLSVAVDQRIMYASERGRVFGDNTRQVTLLDVQDKCSPEEMGLIGEEELTFENDKHRKKKGTLPHIPLLPTPVSPHRSPLLRYLHPPAESSTLAGPGPYTLSATLGLPGCNDPSGGSRGLYFTVKQKSSSVRIDHTLRLVVRAEYVGDKGADDNEGGKKRMFDVAIQTPITILSCRCVPEYQTLPRYSLNTEDGSGEVACACRPSAGVLMPAERLLAQGREREAEDDSGRVIASNSSSSLESEDAAGRSYRQADEQRSAGPEHSRSSSPLGHPLGWRRFSVPPPTHAHSQHRRSGSQSELRTGPQLRQSQSHPHPHPPPPSPLAHYARLVSGLESDAGDAPPSYESITSGF